MSKSQKSKNDTLGLTPADIILDYRLGFMSRELSLIGRKEVLSGKAKFGIFGDGKELPQLAMAQVFEAGDWRSGYYRDQTFMMARGGLTINQFFAQLYADTDIEHDPNSGGRQMNCHFASRFLAKNGEWQSQIETANSSADASPTACQMARLLGLGYASKLYRNLPQLTGHHLFSRAGREIAFGTIGNASTSEGIFWESLNAAGVLEVPMIISIWDDDYGISVPNKYQTIKESISKLCAGFAKEKGTNGIEIYVARGWNYPELIETYRRAAAGARDHHTPALIHVIEISQPQGHSTSGSHERYKSKERLAYEQSIDCLSKMRTWILDQAFITAQELDQLEAGVRAEVQRGRSEAWEEYLAPMRAEREELLGLYQGLSLDPQIPLGFTTLREAFQRSPAINRKSTLSSARRAAYVLRHKHFQGKTEILKFIARFREENAERYNSKLHLEGPTATLNIAGIHPTYGENDEKIDGRLVIQRNFDFHLEHDPRVFILGEDVGKLGGVNLEFEGLQEKHGELRVSDTGIREASIFGQGLGAALRGLRPIVDIQYLDYLLYAFQLMSDDLSSLHYRTAGGQAAPVIVRTKGHRLEGVWHSGSPMGVLLNGLRGMHVCVPRNMVQAAGLYNTLLAGDDPALVVEVLNGYRVKEQVPSNLHSFRVPLGIPEVLRAGFDITIVTYGACVGIVQEALPFLVELGIDIELIDVQTLLPFDRFGSIRSSLEKTNAVLFLDEDVPGGATAFMMQQVLEVQKAYEFLDAAPRTLTAKEHRSPYASDGDYFSKPSPEDLIETLYGMMRERHPQRFPEIFPSA